MVFLWRDEVRPGVSVAFTDTDAGNLALSCQGCNNHKFTAVEAVDPASGNVAPLFHPRRDAWRDHFTWSEDATLMIGLTPSGRATVKKLRLNRPGLVNLRIALRSVGQHPPEEPSDR